MIVADQPTIFGGEVIAALSSKSNGNLKFGLGDDAEVLANREKFLEQAGVDIRHASLVGITYATDNFAKYRIATADDKGVGMRTNDATGYVDALVTRDAGHALFLPIADCAGVILYDPVKHVLMVSHLGRHSVEQDGAIKSVDYLMKECASRAEDIRVWISPSVGKATYPLRAFDGRGLQEIIVEQLLGAGIKGGHIEASNIDTAHDHNYYSHSEFLKGNRETSGRFAIVAMMREQGEPALNMH